MTDNIDNKLQVTILPTTHISTDIYQKINTLHDEYSFDCIAIELDKKRLSKLVTEQDEEKEKTRQRPSITDIIHQRDEVLRYLLSVLQEKISAKLDVELLGKDQYDGYKFAVDNDLPYLLVDRDIDDTVSRLQDQMSRRELIKLLGSLGLSITYITLFKSKDDLENDLRQNIEDNDIDNLIDQLGESFPSFKRVLVDERDRYMANNIMKLREEDDITNVLLTIGEGHLNGIRDILSNTQDINVRTAHL